MARQVRNIIRAQMTILRFLYSKSFAEAYFQRVCHAASGLEFFGYMGGYHPYSFKKMKCVMDSIRSVDETNNSGQ